MMFVNLSDGTSLVASEMRASEDRGIVTVTDKEALESWCELALSAHHGGWPVYFKLSSGHIIGVPIAGNISNIEVE